MEIFTPLHEEFHFTLDVASSGPRLCPRWLGPGSNIAQDALLVSWAGEICFMNPPYSRVAEFVRKAALEEVTGHASTVALLPARTDTRWWHDYVWNRLTNDWHNGVSCRFIKGRVKFINPTGDIFAKANSAPFPSAIVIFGAI
jgi:site-specific DNA-methyltransferase (adenine-specific)